MEAQKFNKTLNWKNIFRSEKRQFLDQKMIFFDISNALIL